MAEYFTQPEVRFLKRMIRLLTVTISMIVALIFGAIYTLIVDLFQVNNWR